MCTKAATAAALDTDPGLAVIVMLQTYMYIPVPLLSVSEIQPAKDGLSTKLSFNKEQSLAALYFSITVSMTWVDRLFQFGFDGQVSLIKVCEMLHDVQTSLRRSVPYIHRQDETTCS